MGSWRMGEYEQQPTRQRVGDADQALVLTGSSEIDGSAYPPTADSHARGAAVIERTLVVVPCLNEAPFIAAVIAALRQDTLSEDCLIVVADGGSTDGTREIVAQIAATDACVQLLANPKRYQGPGINHAVRMFAEGRTWLVRVDAHATYPPGYVSGLVAEARRTGATAVVVSLDARGRNAFQRATAAAQNSRLGTGGAAHRRKDVQGWVDHGHHALIRLDAFRAVSGYDERFTHNEDAEFDRRLTDLGGQIWLTDRLRIVYHPRSRPRALWRQYLNYGSGRARTILKHRMPLKIRQALPAAVAPAVLAAAAAPVFWPVALPVALWSAVALTFGMVLGVRARDPAVLGCGLVAMEMHLAWSLGFWREVLFGDREAGEALPLGQSPQLQPTTDLGG